MESCTAGWIVTKVIPVSLQEIKTNSCIKFVYCIKLFKESLLEQKIF